MAPVTRPPLQLIVAWHPGFADGGRLAKVVLDRFVQPGTEIGGTGLGVPAYIRSAPAPGGAGLPRPIREDSAGATMVCVLVSAELILDRAWQAWLAELVGKPSMHLHAFKFDDSLRIDGLACLASRQAVSVTAADPGAVAVELARRVEAKVLWHLTESNERPILFVSYHSETGKGIADELWRTVTAHYGDLSAYVAHRSVPSGQPYAAHIHEGLNNASVVISVVTDAYASRPWCRDELRKARTPRLANGLDNCWHVKPVVAIDLRGDDWTTLMPELGGHRAIRWDSASVQRVVDRAVSDAVIAAFHARWAERYARENMTASVISWIPDVRTLLRVSAALGLRGARTLVCPGHHADVDERALIARTLPGISLMSFGELRP